MRLLTTAAAAAAAFFACCTSSIRGQGYKALRKEFCELRPQHTTANVTQPASGPNGYRFCPPSFTAALVETQNDGLYGACFLEIDQEQISRSSLNKGQNAGFHANDCRHFCHEQHGADLLELPSSEVEQYVVELMSDPEKVRSHLPSQNPWLALATNRTVGNWTSIVDGSLPQYTNWGQGRPRSSMGQLEAWTPCGYGECVVLITNAVNAGWDDVGCDEEHVCLCQVRNATREGAVVHSLQTRATPINNQPFHRTSTAMALLIASLVLTVGVIGAAACTQNAEVSPRVATIRKAKSMFKRIVAGVGAGTTPTRLSTDVTIMQGINMEKKEERKKFVDRLVDPDAFFVCFVDAKEEKLYSELKRDEGLEGIRLSLTWIFPGIFVCVLVAMVLVLEIGMPLETSTERASWEDLVVLNNRPLYFFFIGGILLLVFVGTFIPNEQVTPALFPYVSLGSAILICIVLGLGFLPIIRYGTLNRKSPWDGLVRTWALMTLIFLPLDFHLSLQLTFVFGVVVALGTEIYLGVLYNFFDYKCECYALVADNRNTVSDHSPMSIHDTISLAHENALLQAVAISLSWMSLLFLVCKIRQRIDLSARESFLRIKDKNTELAKMEEQKHLLEEEMALQQEIAKSEARAAKRVS